jgi:lipid II:glycine glycyltransferase (peptidoglycan interpeptide bridge formation enzyme)
VSQTGSHDEWDEFVAGHPHGHILQTSAWGDLKSAFGWSAERVRIGEAGALVLFRRLPLGLGAVAYVPRGPLVDWSGPESFASLLPALDSVCHKHRAVFLKIEPDVAARDRRLEIRDYEISNHQLPITNLQSPALRASNYQSPISIPGFRPSPHPIQPRRTLIVDISGDEQAILARMKPKCRYNIGLARKKGVTIRPSGDVSAFNQLMQATGSRDAFGVHAPAYFETAYKLFQPRGQCELLIAEHEGRPLAAVMVFALGQRAWYFYGASSDEGRNLMPTYLVQWEAMRWARAKGCYDYDLWGVPDEDESALEAQFESRRDGLWGVYRFKRGFGGKLVRSVGAWDRVYNLPAYWAYQLWARRAGDS